MRRVCLFSVLLAICFLVGCNTDDTDSDGDYSAGDYEIDVLADGDIDADSDTKLPARPEYPMDETLRINQIQVKGTHNSYHVFTDEPQPVFGGDLAPLDVQADQQGVRQFEIDVHYDEERGFVVYHTFFGDTGSNCELLTDCLQSLKDWSDMNPGHQVLFIFIEPKDDFEPLIMEQHCDDLDQLILSVWPQDRLIRPDDVRKEYATLRAAIEADGWPSMAAGRDKAMFFYFDSGSYRDAYLDGHPNAEGRAMFPRADKDLSSPIGAFVNFDDPLTDSDRIAEFAQAGFLIRTRTDVASQGLSDGNEERVQAALSSAAQMISTDYPVMTDLFDYVFDIPDGQPSRCNPLLASTGCTPADVENLP